MTSRKPSPPSVIGMARIFSSGQTAPRPRAIASAASRALALPLKPSGATRIILERRAQAEVHLDEVAARGEAVREAQADVHRHGLEHRGLRADLAARAQLEVVVPVRRL